MNDRLRQMVDRETVEHLNDSDIFDDVPSSKDWRNYIPDFFREIWHDLSVETRVSLYLLTDKVAGME